MEIPVLSRIGRGVSNALVMDTAPIGIAEEEDEQQGVDEEHIFYRMVFFLAAITVGLFSRVLGADNASFRPVMGKSRYAELALEGWPRVTEKMRKSFQEL